MVLEHHAEPRCCGGHVHAVRRCRRARCRSSRTVPPSSASSPATARSTVRLAGAVRPEHGEHLAGRRADRHVELERPAAHRRSTSRLTALTTTPAVAATCRAARTSTMSATAMSGRLSAGASAGSILNTVSTAVGTVCVDPGVLPPKTAWRRTRRARAPSTAPCRRRATAARAARSPARRSAAATRRGWPRPPRARGRRSRTAPSTVITRNGIATNTCATTMAGNGERQVVSRSTVLIGLPSIPLRPNAIEQRDAADHRRQHQRDRHHRAEQSRCRVPAAGRAPRPAARRGPARSRSPRAKTDRQPQRRPHCCSR